MYSSLEFRRAITKVITTAIQTRTWENITMSQNKLKLNKQENCLRREKTQETKESTHYAHCFKPSELPMLLRLRLVLGISGAHMV